MLVDLQGNPLTTSKRRKTATLSARYDAAQDTDENRKHWRWADTMSASAANSIEVRRKLRSRARYECLEGNSFAKGICLTLSNDTISVGPSLQVTTGNPEVNAAIESAWRQWCKATRIASKLRTARLSKIIDGESFILKTTNRRLFTPVQLDVQLVEADQISTPGFIDGMPNKVDGIEFERGQPVNYHMLKSHPGDVWAIKAWEKDDIDPDDMIHMFRVERPGQVRGIPEITPALPLFAFLRRFTLSVILASELAADFAAVLETAASQFDDDEILEEVEAFETVQVDRGMMTALPRGYKMSQFRPEQPTNTYEGFRNAILGEIARCVHMPKNKALADSSAYNYSSGRLDHQTYYEAVAIERSDWEIACLDRIFSWWLDEALMLTGYLPAMGSYYELPHEWRWPPNRDVNPAEIADVNISLIEAGLKTKKQYWIEQNLDPERMVREVASERKGDGSDGNKGSDGNGVEVVGTGGADESIAPPGEFADLSRAQLKRNTKAIDDALANYQDGVWSETRARVFLQSVGLQDRTIEALLDEVVTSS